MVINLFKRIYVQTQTFIRLVKESEIIKNKYNCYLKITYKLKFRHGRRRIRVK